MNQETRCFVSPEADGVVLHRRAGRYLIQFGGPFAPPEAYEALLDDFVRYAQERKLQLVGVQLQRRDAEIYARHGFTVNQVGASYAVDLENFSLQGTRF